jgi:hypothetical protein
MAAVLGMREVDDRDGCGCSRGVGEEDEHEHEHDKAQRRQLSDEEERAQPLSAAGRLRHGRTRLGSH